MQKTPLVLIITGALMLIFGAFIYAQEAGSGTGGASGQRVTCDMKVGAGILTQRLDISDPVCKKVDTCWHSPFKQLFLGIGDVDGELRLVYGGELYDNEDITENRFGSASNYRLEGCVPSTASAVSVQVMNEQGGIDDDVAVTIR